MGIFDFFKKRKCEEQEEEHCPSDVEAAGEADLWSEAYVAKPLRHTKEGKEPLLSFVITEGVNTILPMYPNELYKTSEGCFSDIRLMFVSTTKEGEVVELPFFRCVPALSNYAVEYREPNVLIRGLNAAEMDVVISGVRHSLEHC